jgi:hypothetical protein
MFAMFMETDLIKFNGYKAMINMHSWMFLSKYEKLRQELLKKTTFMSILHLGSRAFESIGGEVVQTASFIMRDKVSQYRTVVKRLVDYSATEKKERFFDINEGIFIRKTDKFKHIPSFIFAYWITESVFLDFIRFDKLSNYGQSKQGLATSDNKLFLRNWQEVNFNRIDFCGKDIKDTESGHYKWFPYSKSGMFRKWSNNNELIVNYENNGEAIKETVMKKYPYLKTPDFVVKNTSSYFKPGITWNDVSTGKFCARKIDEGQIFDASSPMFFTFEYDINLLLAYFNSNVFQLFADIVSQGLHYSTGHIPNIPFIKCKNDTGLIKLVDECIHISKLDWDSFETSWDFKKHSLIGLGKLPTIFSNYKSITKANFKKLKANEEELNEYFIKLYELEDELSKDVHDAYVSISIANKTRDIKSLVSYLIGTLMGRYSLINEGLIYAGGKFDISKYGSNDVDKDGIIPIFSDLSIENGLVHRIIGLIKNIYGEENYRDNVDFIADALGKKSNETSEETLNRYLNDDFYSDHLKIYKKRPIYWMFSSGKKQGFKALIYMHRYNSNTLAKMNASYFQPATTVLRTKISEIEKQLLIALDKDKIQLERIRFSLVEQLNEAIEYGQVLDYMANKYISIDLDDGVKVNYEKFQKIEINTSNGKVKKDLLIPIK